VPFRNVAIVAHVDHGKTTLVDAMLRQSGALHERGEVQERVMDSGDLEREKGITILAKNTAVHRHHPDGTVTVINVIDTPGHADFGGEVERGLSMVDGVLLLVDASEGPLPQTRFVLRKALAAHLPVILVVNKTDRPDARIAEVVEDSHDLLLDVASDLDDEAATAAEHALGLPTLYASGRAGVASTTQPPDGHIPDGTNLDPLFEVLEKHVPPPKGDPDAPLQALVTNLDASTFLGRLALIRIYNGRIRKGQQVAWIREDTTSTAKITELLATVGVQRTPTDEAVAGDIVAVAGLEGVNVGDTVCLPGAPLPLPKLTIDEPTISMDFCVNDSPFAGREGKFVTSRHLKERLEKEARINVGLYVETIEEGKFKVSGRGELHLTILIETMRREGFELSVSSPEVIYKEENGQIFEPYEYLILDIESGYQGAVFELVGSRAAKLENITQEGERMRVEYVIPSRALIGFKNEFLTSTRGKGIMHHTFHGYYPKANLNPLRRNGVFVAKETGETTAYALFALQDGGQMFWGPGEKVYAGMIVGQNSRDNDLVVNPCKAKRLSNMRTSATDESYTLTPPRRFSLEQAIEYVAPDEYVEVTPESLRMRKKVLDHTQRRRSSRIEEEDEN